MKKFTLILLLGLVLPTFGEFRIPRTVFKIDDLAEAKSKAAEKQEPLIFVLTHSGST